MRTYFDWCYILLWTVQWGSFNFKVVRQTDHIPSLWATVTLVPPSGNLVGSNFLLSDESWIITGNKALVGRPSHERFTRGSLLSYYISGADDLINVASSTSPDNSLWYFEAPSRFHGNQGIAYGGFLSFSIAAFSGDFSSLNAMSTNVVELECETCVGPIRQGIRLGFSLSALAASPNGMFKGGAMKIVIPLNENAGWLKDSQDVLVSWYKTSQCDIIQVLSRLSKIRILGDYTTWYETVAIDNVQFSNAKGKLSLLSSFIAFAVFIIYLCWRYFRFFTSVRNGETRCKYLHLRLINYATIFHLKVL